MVEPGWVSAVDEINAVAVIGLNSAIWSDLTDDKIFFGL